MLLGGPDLLLFLVLALGGALVVGNVLALVRPPERPREGELTRAPVARSVGMAILGAHRRDLGARDPADSLKPGPTTRPPCARRIARSRVLAALVLVACGSDAAAPRRELVGIGGPRSQRSPSLSSALPSPAPAPSRHRRPVDIYAADRPNQLSPVVSSFPSLVYVPNSESNTVDVIDPATMQV